MPPQYNRDMKIVQSELKHHRVHPQGVSINKKSQELPTKRHISIDTLHSVTFFPAFIFEKDGLKKKRLFT